MDKSNFELEAALKAFLALRPAAVSPSDPAALKFSIVMPSFNSAPFIERSLLSILNQDWPHIEVIVMDGGSTDGTREIADCYRDQIVFQSAKDKGQSDALNKGFALATGDVFGWLNADDIYMPGAFRAAATALADRNKDMVYGDWLSIGTDEGVEFRHVALPPSLPRLIADGFQFNLQSVFWRAQVHQQAGPFNVRLHRTMDYDFAIGLLSVVPKSRIAVIDEPLGCFRRHADQKTQGFDEKVVEEQRLIAENRGFLWKYSWRVLPVRAWSKALKVAVWLRRGSSEELARAFRRA